MGLDKMLVDEVGDVIITNDGATILKRLDVRYDECVCSSWAEVCKQQFMVQFTPCDVYFR